MLLNCGVGEDSWESLGLQEIQPVHPKGDQSWVFIGRTDVEAETPIVWPPDAKNWLIRKDPDAGKDWSQKGKRMTEDEMVGWHHWLNEHEFGQAPEDGEGQGSLVCCSPETDTTEWLNNSNNHFNGRKQRGTQEPFDEGERGSEKVGLKLNIQKSKIMVSSPIILWQIDGSKMETVTEFTLLESPWDCREIKPVNLKWNQRWIFIHWKNWCWSWSSNILATWWEELTH